MLNPPLSVQQEAAGTPVTAPEGAAAALQLPPADVWAGDAARFRRLAQALRTTERPWRRDIKALDFYINEQASGETMAWGFAGFMFSEVASPRLLARHGSRVSGWNGRQPAPRFTHFQGANLPRLQSISAHPHCKRLKVIFLFELL
jgi:hypothetical protein